MRVLIIEDAPEEAELFAQMVAHHGHDPFLAESGEVALERLDTAVPDAVLLDVSLPGMSGAEFLRIVRERRPGLAVVAISGVVTEDLARRCLKLGAVEFLPKPLTVDQLGIVLNFLQTHLLTSGPTAEVPRVERRRYPRVQVPVEIAVEEPSGAQWRGHLVSRVETHGTK